MTPVECPFLTLCDRDFTGGPLLSDEEQEGLQVHLSEGCSSCEDKIEEHLSGSGDSDDALVVRELGARLTNAVKFAGDAMAPAQLKVLARVRDRIASEDREAQRRVRRRHQRILFYVVNLAAVFLICVAYTGTLMATKVKDVAARRLSAENEVHAMASALARYMRDHPPGPEEIPSLVVVLQTPRSVGSTTPYYRFDPTRLDAGGYRDDFGRAYRLSRRPGGAVVYSFGPDGVDDWGEGDDIARHLVLP